MRYARSLARPAATLSAVGLSILVGIGRLGVPVAARWRNESPAAAPATPARARRAPGDLLGDPPLRFERNEGQTDAQVKFVSRGSGYTLFLTPGEAVLSLRRPGTQAGGRGEGKREVAALRVRLLGANSAPEIAGEGQLAGTANYFIGNDPARWRTMVPTYAKVRYREIYPGIDLVYYYSAHGRRLEYDFVLAPGADPRAIALRFDGASRLALDGAGDLVVTLADGGTLVHTAPVVYQERAGRRETVEGRCALRGDDSVGFELATYDRTRPVYIDPGLVYSTYLGGTDGDHGFAVAVDASGNAYVTGITNSSDFPTTPGAFVTTPPGGGNMFVTKVAADGSGLVYSTYLGGDVHDNFEDGFGIAVDAAGSAYVTGKCGQGTFPTTAGAFQTAFGGGYTDAFVTKLAADGSGLVYSTLLGGGDADEGLGIAVDASGAAYVAGDTSSNNLVCRGIALPNACCTGFHTGTCNFPTTAGAFQTANNAATVGTNAFVTKVKPDGSGLVYSTYLGGSHGDKAVGIAVDATGHAYVTGNSTSADLPTTTGAFRTTKPSQFSIWDTPFVAKLTTDGTGLAYSTYLGGSQPDDAAGIALDSGGNAYVTGTASSTDFPTTPGAFRTTNLSENYYNVFVTRMNSSGTGLVYSTYLGGTDGEEQAFGIALGDAGHAYVTGRTNSGNFPTTADAYQTSLRSAGWNAFVTKLRVDGGGLVYSTYLGGNGPGDYGYAIAVDGDGDAYVTGQTSGGFPITNGAPQGTEAGSIDAFVAKLAVPSGPDPTTTTTTTTTVFSSTSTSTTTRSTVPTTTTTLPCASARCTLARLRQSPACAGQTIPPAVTAKLTQAGSLIDQAASSPAKQAKKLLKRAKKSLKQAKTKVTRAAKGKHPQLSPACASALGSGVAGVLAGLGV